MSKTKIISVPEMTYTFPDNKVYYRAKRFVREVMVEEDQFLIPINLLCARESCPYPTYELEDWCNENFPGRYEINVMHNLDYHDFAVVFSYLLNRIHSTEDQILFKMRRL